MSLLYITSLTLFEIIGDFSIQQYVKTNNLSFLGLGVGGYIAVIGFLIAALKQRNILFVNAGWDGVSAITETLAAFFILGERLENPSEYIGLLLVMSGIFFLYGNPLKIITSLKN